MTPWARVLAKAVVPKAVVRLVRWRRDVWSDLRLRLLADVGRFPSHGVRSYFYRRSGMQLDPSSSIHWRAEFYAPERIVIGDHCTIGDSCFLDGRSGLLIGASVHLGSHVRVYTREHDVQSSDFAETGGPVVIGDRAWLASHCIVLPGVTIGQGAVVAAGAVVTGNVAPYSIVAGVPARPVAQRNRDLRYQLGYAKRFV